MRERPSCHEGGEKCGNPYVDTEHLPDFIGLDDEVDTNDGWDGNLSPVTVREQRVARARKLFGFTMPKQDLGDQVDQAVAAHHRTMDVPKVRQLPRNEDDSVIRKALQLLHVKLYHCQTERLQSIFRAAGVPPKACNVGLQVWV